IAVVFDIQPAAALVQQPGDIAGIIAEDSDRGAGAVASAQPGSSTSEGPPAAGVIGDHQQLTRTDAQVAGKVCGVHLVEPEVFADATVPAGYDAREFDLAAIGQHKACALVVNLQPDFQQRGPAQPKHPDAGVLGVVHARELKRGGGPGEAQVNLGF